MSKLKPEFRIKELLAQRQDSRGRRMNMTSLALAIDEAYGTVAGVVYGNRVNPAVRIKIAGFLGLEVEELFGESIRIAGEDACATDAGATEDVAAEGEVAHG